jgi:hypothetical protein
MPAAAASAAPCRRSPAQIEASRRNGARSNGPVTPEGKARASRNALEHGLAALHHLVLEDEVPGELEELTARLMQETGAASELEARLVRRPAVAFWKGERAERMEVALLDGAPRVKSPARGGTWEAAEAAETFDVRRFNAIRGHQAAQGREISRCLKELRLLRREPFLAEEDEPEPPVAINPGTAPGGSALVPGSRVFTAAWNRADRRLQAVQAGPPPALGAATSPGSGKTWPSARASLP